MPRSVRVDTLDRRIVAALQRDGRRPFTSIGRELGISEAAVRQRVARLQAAGIMQVVAVADPMALGYQAIAMVAIEADGRAWGVRPAERSERGPAVPCGAAAGRTRTAARHRRAGPAGRPGRRRRA